MSVDLHDPSSQAYKKVLIDLQNTSIIIPAVGKAAIFQLYAEQEKHGRLDTVQSCRETFQSEPVRIIYIEFAANIRQARFPPPDLSDVLDLALLDETRALEIQTGVWKGTSNALDYRELTPKASSSNIKAYTTPHIPGLILLPGFLSPGKQKELVCWSLADHARQPNETNLDIHYVLPEDGLWNVCERARCDHSQDLCVQPRASTSSSEIPPTTEPSGPRQLVNNTPATPDNFVALSATPKPPSAPSATVQPMPASALLRKLRWANIGWVSTFWLQSLLVLTLS